MMRRYGLRDDQWERIEGLLPGRQKSVGVTALDNRLFVEAVLYRYRAGIPWRDLPERYGDWKNVHRRHSRWSESGVWEKLFKALAEDGDNEYAMIDSTIVRAHQHAAGAHKKGVRRPKMSADRKPSDVGLLPENWAILNERESGLI
jgi:transposase